MLDADFEYGLVRKVVCNYGDECYSVKVKYPEQIRAQVTTDASTGTNGIGASKDNSNNNWCPGLARTSITPKR